MEEFIITGSHTTEKHALAFQMRRAMTFAERLLWEQFRGNRLNGLHFRRQQIISGFIVDFYCHSARLVIEVDGGVHLDQQNYDTERSRILTANQLTILRFTNDQVTQDMPTILSTVLSTVQIITRQRPRETI